MSSSRAILEAQKKYYRKGLTRDPEFRILQLQLLSKVIRDNETNLMNALHKDINRSEYESYLSEFGLVYKEISEVCKNLRKWVKPVKVSSESLGFGTQSYYVHEPRGVVLVMSPWSFPVQLSFMPLVAAIAAGNCTVMKLSEQTPEVSKCIETMISDNFKPEYIQVVRGDKNLNIDLLQLKFDHVFFSGSSAVGKKVMRLAAENLTSLTLELGGKNPCVIDKTANLDVAARRIIWGKFLSAGQSCIAPDYILIDESIKEEFVTKLVDEAERQFGAMVENGSYTKIISEKQVDRLSGFLEEVNVLYGGQFSVTSKTFVPTIVDCVPKNHPLMDEEIFGPILPVHTFKTTGQVIDYILENENPLCFYLFSSDDELQTRLIDTIPFGGGCINDTTVHAFNFNLPFGGTGQSGIGKYHGKFGFEAFSNRKSIVKRGWKLDPSYRYPPFDNKKLSLLKRFMK